MVHLLGSTIGSPVQSPLNPRGGWPSRIAVANPLTISSASLEVVSSRHRCSIPPIERTRDWWMFK